MLHPTNFVNEYKILLIVHLKRNVIILVVTLNTLMVFIPASTFAMYKIKKIYTMLKV